MVGFQKSASVFLVDVERLEAAISSLSFTDPEQQYLRTRWLHQVRWWDERARSARHYFYWVRSFVVGGAALVPFLLTIGAESAYKSEFAVVAALVSVIVAISAGIEFLHIWGGVWLEKRNAAEGLKAEGLLFMYRAGVYADQSTAFAKFVDALSRPRL